MVEIEPEIFAIAGEVEAMVASGNVKAIVVVMVMENGDLNKKLCITPYTKLPLLAGLELAAHGLKEQIHRSNPEHDV